MGTQQIMGEAYILMREEYSITACYMKTQQIMVGVVPIFTMAVR